MSSALAVPQRTSEPPTATSATKSPEVCPGGSAVLLALAPLPLTSKDHDMSDRPSGNRPASR
jgi:hypothetical protein